MQKYHVVRIAPHCAPEVIKVNYADDYPVGLLPESPTFLKPFHNKPIIMMAGRYSNLDGKDTSYGANRFLYSKKKPLTINPFHRIFWVTKPLPLAGRNPF